MQFLGHSQSPKSSALSPSPDHKSNQEKNTLKSKMDFSASQAHIIANKHLDMAEIPQRNIRHVSSNSSSSVT